MNSKLITLLAACSLLLLVGLFMEWSYSDYSKKELLNFLQNVEEQNYQESKLPTMNLSEVHIEHYSEMVEKPLFIDGRKPVVEGEIGDVELVDAGKIEDWVLVGIYSLNDQLTALFKGIDKEKKHLKKKQGEAISGWKLTEILADRVIVEQSGKKQSIMLRKPKPKPVVKSRSRGKAKPTVKKRKKKVKL